MLGEQDDVPAAGAGGSAVPVADDDENGGSAPGEGNAATLSDLASRLAALAAFQVSAVCHAMQFPAVRRIVYSTCSVHREENEDVVAKVLRDAGRAAGFRLIPALPGWHRRGFATPGLSDKEVACVVRVDPAEDSTNGFFVALFEREGSAAVLRTHLKLDSNQADADAASSGGGREVPGTDATATPGVTSEKHKKKRRRKSKKKEAASEADAEGSEIVRHALPAGDGGEDSSDGSDADGECKSVLEGMEEASAGNPRKKKGKKKRRKRLSGKLEASFSQQ